MIPADHITTLPPRHTWRAYTGSTDVQDTDITTPRRAAAAARLSRINAARTARNDGHTPIYAANLILHKTGPHTLRITTTIYAAPTHLVAAPWN